MRNQLTNSFAGLLALGVSAGLAWAGTPIKVFIFSGQSNMTGEFGLDELEFNGTDLALPQSDILSDYWITGANPVGGDWYPLQIHTEVTNTSYGSELAFMRAVKDADPTTEYASLKLTRGGANLADRWAPHNNDIYPLVRDYAFDALQRLTDLGYEPEIAGIIWVHGDGDLFVESHSEEYDINLTELVTAFRTDLAAPDAPVLISQTHIDQRNGNSFVPIQRQRKLDYQATDPNSFIIDVDDLTYRDFFVHFDGTSRHIIGQRMADVWIAENLASCTSLADVNQDGLLDNGDLIDFVGLFISADPAADLSADGLLDNGDIIAFIQLYLAGC